LATELSKSSMPDTIASGLIGLMLFAASGFLLQINRDLIGGRGLAPSTLQQMRSLVASQEGVAEVPDLFAIIVGAMSVVVDGNVIFHDDLSAAVVEQTIIHVNEELRKRWPMIQYIYLTPVPPQPSRVAWRSGSDK
jgi:divalent metal cation (Fe/Co/Zn/Cd) transporter